MRFKESLQVKDLTLRNRIVMPPMATNKAVDGKPAAELIAYYRKRARGTALVIVEHAYILPEGMAHAGQLSMADDDVIEAYRPLTAAAHEEGALIFAQINHAGARAQDTGMPAKGPSAVSVRGSKLAQEMTKDDICQVIRAFAEAAIRVKKAGFDGVEIHSAHGYLLNQFYSPLVNQRQDAYAVQPMENRIRLHLAVIRAVREAVGPDYPIAIRFGGCDYTEGGSQLADAPVAAMAFENAGVDLIDLSGGILGYQRPDHKEPGYFKDMSLAVKEAVSVPVILTGGVTAAAEMEALLDERAADLIGVGRALLQDGDWSVKALTGRA